jgi:hypothetical protein
MSKVIIIGFVDKGWRMIKAYISITHFSLTFVKLEEAKCQKTSIDYLVLKLIRVIQGDIIETGSQKQPFPIHPATGFSYYQQIHLVFRSKFVNDDSEEEKSRDFPVISTTEVINSCT